ncbi:SRPBCC family protein [Bosea sp. (in: a-proteobacteria)]|uniref:SRPBCC family protein n=1 Tax=Bosea sp. (in: a-proteobacteria) TaxID=1871050 RepID=UPI001AD03E33|nr:SRPBCC family protein [Bosea sp. (in: a-proteobacteria)]MBN9439104.1 SRPBCC family protein [Bosea sp. (in: a-proteobacteria)]
MSRTPVTHASFTIERSYAAPPAKVFAAFADPAIKRRWFAEGEGWTVEQFDVDFRVGGFERSRFRYQGGPPITNESVYQVIQPNERIILAYAMAIDGVPLSGSLLTMEYLPEGSGTKLVFTEQGAYLGGKGDPVHREEGSRELLESLARILGEEAKAA